MPSNKLFVGNLSYQTSEAELRELFSAYGQIVSINLLSGKGFGFVEMDSPASAQSAKEALNGKELGGRTIAVDEARPPKKREGGSRGGYGGGGGRRGDFQKRRPRW